MQLFEENYKYKLKLLGYSMQFKKDEYIKVNLYILSHGQIHNISYIHTIETNVNYLLFLNGYDDMELFHAEFFGICDEVLNLKKVIVNKENLENIPYNSTILQLFNKNSEIITTKYFSMDLKNNQLVLYPEEFKQISRNGLLKKLINNSNMQK